MKKKHIKKKMTLPRLKKKVWKAFSIYIRHQTKEYIPCYTCGQVNHWTCLHAGHAIAGRHNGVIFDLFLVRPQCAKCNIYNGGEYGKFAAKLIREFGLEWYEAKQRLCSKGSSRIVKYTRDEYIEMLQFFTEHGKESHAKN